MICGYKLQIIVFFMVINGDLLSVINEQDGMSSPRPNHDLFQYPVLHTMCCIELKTCLFIFKMCSLIVQYWKYLRIGLGDHQVEDDIPPNTILSNQTTPPKPLNCFNRICKCIRLLEFREGHKGKFGTGFAFY